MRMQTMIFETFYQQIMGENVLIFQIKDKPPCGQGKPLLVWLHLQTLTKNTPCEKNWHPWFHGPKFVKLAFYKMVAFLSFQTIKLKKARGPNLQETAGPQQSPPS